MNKEIAIIGVNGKMGKWFAEYFHKMGFKVKGFDTNNEIKEKFIIKANSLVGAILQMDYVLLWTPTKNTPEIIRLIAKEMKRGSYLIEISSQKSKTALTLLKTPSKVNPICIHPMFGPGTKKIDGKNIIIVPVKDAQKELSATKFSEKLLEHGVAIAPGEGFGDYKEFFRITAIDETKLKEGMIILDTILKESYE